MLCSHRLADHESTNISANRIGIYDFGIGCGDSNTVQLDCVGRFPATIRVDAGASSILLQELLRQMPPEDEKQPTNEEKTVCLDDLSNTMVRARKLLNNAGGVSTMRRLNRRDCVNTIRDLFGVTLDANELPNDAGSGTFGAVGSSLFFSSSQFERYLALARKAVDKAIVADN